MKCFSIFFLLTDMKVLPYPCYTFTCGVFNFNKQLILASTSPFEYIVYSKLSGHATLEQN